ncbi:NotI family restriction endonuclease [uncultured Thalassospira sp.]|uniref:NotI family restriction endonuclease n=1 Tax=uncultured Thalassospira sp. TaxID=404382 RepID=UPI00258CFC15|nr:NotI family restriction endonuclease [uncultured Thalassospira sp.]
MASVIWDFFGYRAIDQSETAKTAIKEEVCPFLNDICEKTFNDKTVAGVCAVKPVTSPPVICCPIRLYANGYKVLQDVVDRAFVPGLKLIPGREALSYVHERREECVAVFGQRWGGELRLPQKDGRRSYFVDWILARISERGELVEFVAVEVQTIDTTGTYRNGYEALKNNGTVEKTTAGLNWENVSKRILPQLIYKGQVLQRENLCKKGLFFICPEPVLKRVTDRLGGQEALSRYPLQPASLTFLAYNYSEVGHVEGEGLVLEQTSSHSTTVYKVQEAFNNVTLPDENVYQEAIIKALGNPDL